MTAATATPASSFEDVYVRARRRGDDDRAAVGRAMHAYGGNRREDQMSAPIARARAAWDRANVEPLQVGDDVEGADNRDAATDRVTEPDAFAEPEAEIRKRIEDLDAQRGMLALDSISDAKVRDKLADVEHRLSGARLELQHVGLARSEQRRRDQAEREAAEAKRIEDALAEASKLQRDRDAAAIKVDHAALALGAALAEHHAISARQSSFLIEAGRIEIYHQALVSDGDLEAMLAAAFAASDAPADWLSLSASATNRARPLAEGDRRLVEAAPSKTTTSKGNR